MTPCDRHREDLAAYVYADLDGDAARAVEAHLKGCAGCREELRALQRVTHALSAEAAFPREREVDWDAFARATVERAVGFRARPARAARPAGLAAWWRQVWRAPGLASAAAGLLVVAGAALGTYGVLRWGPGAGAPEPVLVAESAAAMPVRLPASMLADIETTSARAGTQRYLAESRALLLSLLGAPIRCEKDTVDIRDERAKSLDLIRRQRLIADDLEALPLARARDVCRDIERLLLEIVALNDCARADQIRELKSLVEGRQIMLRLELLSEELKRGSRVDV